MPLIRAGYKLIHYSAFGPTTGARETFIFAHGLGSSQNYYGAVIPRLTAENLRCIALDTTGSARSPPTCIEQSVETLAEDVINVMDALSVDKAVFVGHSMAGMTGPQLAAQYPTRITALVLIGPVYPQKDVAATFEQRIAAVEKGGMEVMASTVPYAAVGSRAQPIHSAFIRELLMGQTVAGYVGMCKVIATAWQSPPAYDRVQCPLLVIAGEEDKSTPMAMANRIVKEVGSEEKLLTMLHGVGHWQCIEAPDEVAEAIVSFYKQIS